MSDINYASINENFPVAGQDNDTQVFRDNFDTIKTSLRAAYTEVTDLQNNTAKLNEDNDFNGSVVENAVLLASGSKTNPSAGVDFSPLTIDYGSGHYQIYTFNAGSDRIDFSNFPTAGTVCGKVTLECYGSGSSIGITFQTVGGTVIKKSNFPSVAAEFTGSDFVISDTDNPIILEIWQHSTDNIFINYVGQFS